MCFHYMKEVALSGQIITVKPHKSNIPVIARSVTVHTKNTVWCWVK